MNKKLLIFDLDGTIADTIYSIRDGVNLALELYGYPTRDYEQIRRAIGNGARELIRLSLPEECRGDEKTVDCVLADYDKLYALTYDRLDGCYDGMEESMRTLVERGYTLAILSNKQDTYVKKITELLFPDGIIAFAAGQVAGLPKKPDPTVPLDIARRFGMSAEECAFIGDSEVDVQTAKNAGMLSVACSWGYRPRASLEGADAIIDAPTELCEIFV